MHWTGNFYESRSGTGHPLIGDRSIRGGAIRASGWYFAEGGLVQSYFEALADHYHFSLDTILLDNCLKKYRISSFMGIMEKKLQSSGNPAAEAALLLLILKELSIILSVVSVLPTATGCAMISLL